MTKDTNVYSNDLYQTTVYLWGVKPKAHKLSHQIKVKLLGGNVGHAAIALKFPADERGDELINKYCNLEKNPIPYNKFYREIIVNGKKTNTPYYEVYFSAWPGTPIYFNTLLKDQIDERNRINYNYKKNAPFYESEEIDYRKLKYFFGLAKKTITLPPRLVINNAIVNHKYAKEINIIVAKFKRIFHELKINEDNFHELKLEYDFLMKKTHSDKEIQSTILKIEDQASKIQEKIWQLEDEYKTLYQEQKQITKYNIDNYIKIGKLPDNKSYLPTIDSENSKHSNKNGLDLERMLQEMRIIADDPEEFNLHKKNCSSTTLRILQSGVLYKDRMYFKKHLPKIRKYLDKNSWIFKMFTPQSVYNIASKTEKVFSKRKGIGMPYKAIFNKPESIKKILNGLKIMRTFFVNQNKFHRLIDNEEINNNSKTKRKLKI